MRNISTERKTKAQFIDWIAIIAIYVVMMSFFMILWYLFCFMIKKQEILNTDGVYNAIYYTSLVFSLLIYPIFKDLLFDCGSIGCKISKIKIVDEGGNKPSKKQLLYRGVFFHIFFIDYFVSKKRSDNRSLTDIITKTRQVYLPDSK